MSPHLDVDYEEVENYRGFALGSRVTVLFLTLLARRMCMFAEDRILTKLRQREFQAANILKPPDSSWSIWVLL